jgi:hypothetical protein
VSTAGSSSYHSRLSGAETLARSQSSSTTSYFLPFVRGKTLWFISGLARPALFYLTCANAAIERAITVDKLDKRYRALVVCELHKIRLHTAMRLLAGVTCSRLPVGCDVPDVASSAAQNDDDSDGVCDGDGMVSYLEDICLISVLKKRTHSAPGYDQEISASASSVSVLMGRNGSSGLDLSNDTNEGTSDGSKAVAASLVLPRIICPSCGVCTTRAYGAEASTLALKLCGADTLQPCPIFTTVATCTEPLTTHRQTHRQRLWSVVVDALRGLRSCRQWDAYDFKSVFLISNFLLSLQGSYAHSSLRWAQPPVSIATDLVDVCSAGSSSMTSEYGAVESNALMEIHKLFEKRRPQVVAIWTHENSPHRFDQVSNTGMISIMNVTHIMIILLFILFTNCV